ncbi:MAG: hypothetical protein AAB439_03390 [Patescibacteria group bacterium]
MDSFIDETFHKELQAHKDPVAVSEALKTNEGVHLAEEFLESVLPMPYGLSATGESAPEELAMLVLEHIVFPYL